MWSFVYSFDSSGGILVDTPEDPPHSILYDKDELDYSLDRIRKSGLRYGHINQP